VDLRRHDDPAAFLERVRPTLLRGGPDGEARHNLLLGIAGVLVSDPSVYPNFSLWTVEDRGTTVVCALHTPPFNLALSMPAAEGSLELLSEGLAREKISIPGVTAAVPEVDAFADAWSRSSGIHVRARMGMGVYRLTKVRWPRQVPGRLRDAVTEDRPLVLEWLLDFDATVHDEPDPGRMEDVVRRRVPGNDLSGLVLWEVAGKPVSLAGFGSPTPNGMRIGPVYTPPDERGRGYASALVAAVSSRCLEGGRTFCFLFTDLANPTSNHVYQAIGYEHVCDARDLAFGRT
jgi:predicted GNAT family acetyltransferase